jgi:hypothetical protein
MNRVRKLFNGNVQVGDMTLGATSLDSSMQIGQPGQNLLVD